VGLIIAIFTLYVNLLKHMGCYLCQMLWHKTVRSDLHILVRFMWPTLCNPAGSHVCRSQFIDTRIVRCCCCCCCCCCWGLVYFFEELIMHWFTLIFFILNLTVIPP